MAFQFERLEIPDVILVQAQKRGDERGFFMESYKQSAFAAGGIAETFVQDNCSHSACSVLRGLHYQKHPQAQGKLVMALQGEIFDVAADIRRASPTYGAWVGRVLSAENACMLYVPPGFAHGYCVLSQNATIVYKVTQEYNAELDRGIIWNDPQIGVEWPIKSPVLSTKDAQLPRLQAADHNF